jgi:hypothetical protein
MAGRRRSVIIMLCILNLRLRGSVLLRNVIHLTAARGCCTHANNHGCPSFIHPPYYICSFAEDKEALYAPPSQNDEEPSGRDTSNVQPKVTAACYFSTATTWKLTHGYYKQLSVSLSLFWLCFTLHIAEVVATTKIGLVISIDRFKREKERVELWCRGITCKGAH